MASLGERLRRRSGLDYVFSWLDEEDEAGSEAALRAMEDEYLY